MWVVGPERLAKQPADRWIVAWRVATIGTPGHTPGSISLFDTATGILVAGDAITGDGQGGLTGANPDFTPDMAAANTSVAKLAALMPSTAAFGHGGSPVSDDVATKLAALVCPDDRHRASRVSD